MSRTKSRRRRPTRLTIDTLEDRTTPTGSPTLRSAYTIAGPGFDDNNPLVAAPASPSLAAGKGETVQVVDQQLQIRAIPNGSSSQVSLQSFFSPLSPSSSTSWSSTRVLYDPYFDRFVVAAVGTVSSSQQSHVFMAVSKTGSPTTATNNWNYTFINAFPTLNGNVTYTGYMGLGMDQNFVYVTTTHFDFSGNGYENTGLTIVDKGTSGGWYSGGTPSLSSLKYPGALGDTTYEYLVPATMYTSPTPPGSGVGTYLVTYNGQSSGGNESALVVEVDNPSTSGATFVPTTVGLGNIDTNPGSPLPLAPEPHSAGNGAFDLNVGPRLVPNAVWRDNGLYFGSTVNKAGTDTAHWFWLDTSGTPVVHQQADVNTSTIAAMATYQPAVAVDGLDDLAVAFSGSNSSRGVQGYYAARTPNLANDPMNTLRDPIALGSSNSNEYIRRDSAGNNNWGQYSSIAVGADDRVFWTFNANADTPSSSGTAPDFGRWATSGGAFSFNFPPETSGIPDEPNATDNTPDYIIHLNQYFSDYETANAGLFSYTFSSSNPSLVTVSPSGQDGILVHIPRPNSGTAVITVTCADPGTADAAPASVTATFKIHVTHVDLPAEVTIVKDPATNNPTNATTVRFDVTFDQNVTGFDASGIDTSTSTTGGPLNVNVIPVDGAHYYADVSGMPADGDVIASVLANHAFNPSHQGNNASPTAATVTVDYTPPTVTIDKQPTQPDPTNVASIKFNVAFSEPIQSFPGSAVDLSSSTAGGSLSAAVTPAGGNNYVVTVTGMTSPGLVIAKIDLGAVQDLAGNGNTASTSTNNDNQVTFDNQNPSVTVNQAATQGDPAGGSTVYFDVQFSEPVLGFDGSKVTLSPGGLTATVTPGGPPNSYVVAVTGMTADGTITASINPGVVHDLAGNPNNASTGTDNSVSYIHSGTIQLSAASYTTTEAGGPVLHVTVNRAGGSNGPLSVDYATADGTGADKAVAGVDYTAASGTLNWAPGDFSAKTIDIPIIDLQMPETDKQFSVSLSNVSLSGALNPNLSAAPITINKEGGIEFTSATFNTTEGAGTATITVKRVGGLFGASSINYSTADGTATAGQDYTTATGTLNWPGDGNPANDTQSFTVPITQDAINEGKETILLSLSGLTGNAVLASPTTATLVIAADDGITVNGTDAKPSNTFTDADGDQVTISLGGKTGSLTYYLTNGQGPISEIDLAGTDPLKSTVTVAVKKPKGGTGDGKVGIGEVDGTGFKSFTAKASDLTGAGFNLTGFAGSITVANVTNGADFELAGAQPTTKSATKIAAKVIGDNTDINVAAPLAGLTAIAVGNGTIEAPSIGTIKVSGQKANAAKGIPAISGDFNSALTVSGAGLSGTTAAALKSLSVAGAVNNAVLSVNGNVGAVSVGSFFNSRLFVGYTGPDDGSGTFSFGTTLTSFTVKGTTNAFAHSDVIAPTIKTVSLASLDPTNGGTKFGILYHSTLGALSVKSPAFKFNPKGPSEQDLAPDFYVKKV